MEPGIKSMYRVRYSTPEKPEGVFYKKKRSFRCLTVICQARRKREEGENMDELRNCGHEQDEMCSCIRSMNIARQYVFLAANIKEVSWEFDYDTLDKPGKARLCIVGICGQCGSRLCCGVRVGVEYAGDELLECIFTYLTLFHRLDGLQMEAGEFDRKILMLFHEEDQSAVKKWLDKRCAV